MRNKVGVLIESDFCEPEIYYSKWFKDFEPEVHFLTRLCGNAELTSRGMRSASLSVQ